MKKILILVSLLVCNLAHAQQSFTFKITVEVSDEMKASFTPGGRLLVHVTNQKEKEPRNKSEFTIGVTPDNWISTNRFVIDTKSKKVLTNGIAKLAGHTAEMYYYQVVYKQNKLDGNENVAGNLYSQVDSSNLRQHNKLSFRLQSIIPKIEIVKHPFVQFVEIRSKYLSDFFGDDRTIKAAILLPSGYFDHPTKKFPICYRAPGLNGRFHAINGMMGSKDFTDWWFSINAPQVIYVFLDSQGPYGDTYQVDSENNGPCGKALTEELIPAIEKLVHYQSDSKLRYVTGYSTGGWIAMGLQIFYPDFFDGAWAYSPDPLEFEHYGLIDIYHDETIFYNKFGYPQPGRRTTNDEPTLPMKNWINGENTNSRTNDYRISGGQMGAYNAVFGPRGNDGLPSLMFDPITGKIDHAIAKQWEKYDLKKVLENNWSTLGPKLQGKIWIWSGDMDGIYSNVATRYFQKFIQQTTHPTSDAIISFTPMAGHIQEWNDKSVLTLIAAKAAKTK